MAIKFNGSTVNYIKYNSSTSNIKRVKYNGTQIWVKPYTLNVTIDQTFGTLNSYSIVITSSETGTGVGSRTVVNGDTVYEGEYIELRSYDSDGKTINTEGLNTLIDGDVTSSTYNVKITVLSS